MKDDGKMRDDERPRRRSLKGFKKVNSRHTTLFLFSHHLFSFLTPPIFFKHTTLGIIHILNTTSLVFA